MENIDLELLYDLSNSCSGRFTFKEFKERIEPHIQKNHTTERRKTEK